MKKLTVLAMTLVMLVYLGGTDLKAATPATLSDYLILQSIGSYSSDGKGKCGNGPGLLAAADHFRVDHNDTTCDTGYYNVAQDMAVEIQVTKHSGSDSDKWLRHEVDRDFRNYYGIPGKTYGPGAVDGQTILEDGRNYRWLSNYTVIEISYHDAQMEKPEPIEVVKAYLTKFPSTLTAFTLKQLRSTEYETTWIKDEMDRRLWLCDKWFTYLQTGKTDTKTVIQNAVKSMNIFLDYREKYYSVKAADDKNLLAGYLSSNDGTSIKAKLTEYKNWWGLHKNDSISL